MKCTIYSLTGHFFVTKHSVGTVELKLPGKCADVFVLTEAGRPVSLNQHELKVGGIVVDYRAGTAITP